MMDIAHAAKPLPPDLKAQINELLHERDLRQRLGSEALRAEIPGDVSHQAALAASQDHVARIREIDTEITRLMDRGKRTRLMLASPPLQVTAAFLTSFSTSVAFGIAALAYLLQGEWGVTIIYGSISAVIGHSALHLGRYARAVAEMRDSAESVEAED